MPRYKMTIAYHGANYSGWQVQPNGVSIQGTIEEALFLLLKEKKRVIGAGRTDAGVHAKAQVAHFDSSTDCTSPRFLLQLNGILPKDIRVKEIEEVPPHFHAQRSAVAKIYHYHLWLEKSGDPFLSSYHLQVHQNISLHLLKEGAKYFLGKKDFAAFTNCGSSAKTTVRTLFRLDVVEEEGGVRLEFEGDGFLYKMVRNITGTLLEVAKGKRLPETLPALFEGKDRKKSGLAASAKGLFLEKVVYPQEFSEGVKVEKVFCE